MAFTKRVFLIFSLLATFSIILQVSAGSTTPVSNSEVTINNTNNDSQITVQKDKILVVKLLVNPGIGYGWQIIKNDTDKLKPLGDSALEELEAGVPGATENQVFRFSAQGSGSTILEFHYLRPWERNVSPLKTYRVEVQIP